jgi:hypothetical protein
VNPWRRWVALLDHREPATALALCRIAVGLIVALHLGRMLLLDADRLVWADASFGGLRTLEPGWLAHLGGLTAQNIRALTALTTFAGLTFAIGLYTRLSGIVLWLGFRTLADLNGHSGGAYDELLKNELLLLVVSGCGATLSLDAWRSGATHDHTAPAWPRYVLVFQLALMYWSTGMQKVSDGWVPGGSADALWYILQQPTWQRMPMTWVAPAYPLTQVATLGTWLFEQGAPILLLAFWFRRTRTRAGRLRALFNRLDVRALYLFTGIAMHVGIEATMEVGAFSAASLALYLCCFHPDEWAALGRRLGLVRVSAAATERRPA